MFTSSLEKARFNMVQQQICPWHVADQQVLNVLAEVPREAFVPPKYRQLAFADIEIPIGQGQRMMPPRLEARLLQALDIQPGDKVLEVGTGSGYLTACLTKLGGHVISTDIHSEFTQQATDQLETLGIGNTSLLTEDGLSGAVEGGPFDKIAVTGSLPCPIEALQRQLKPGGCLFVVTGEAPAMKAVLITRTGEDAWRTEALFETELAPLSNAPAAEPFRF